MRPNQPDSATAQAEGGQDALDQARDQANAGDGLHEHTLWDTAVQLTDPPHNTASGIDDDTNTEPVQIACAACGLSAFRLLQRIETGHRFSCCARRKVIEAIGDIAYAGYRLRKELGALGVGCTITLTNGQTFQRIDADHVVELKASDQILDIGVDDRTIPF